MLGDCHLTLKDLIEQVPASFGFCQGILEDYLVLKCFASWVVQRTLILFQKQCVQLTQEMPSEGTFFHWIVTGDEMWIYTFDLEAAQK